MDSIKIKADAPNELTQNNTEVTSDEVSAPDADEAVSETQEELVKKDFTAEQEAELDRLRCENEQLRQSLVCVKLGIPAELEQDIICIAKCGCASGEMTFEQAAQAAVKRLCRTAPAMTTGTHLERSPKTTDSALRAAFGLKN